MRYLSFNSHLPPCPLLTPQPKSWYLKEHRFSGMTSNLRTDNFMLSQQLCQVAKSLWNAGNVLALDESIFEYLGTCPVKKYIPRKPHPNGLQAICVCSWTYVRGEKMPVLLDVEPNCSVTHNPTPHIAFMRIVDRMIQVLFSFILIVLPHVAGLPSPGSEDALRC
jgi:Transposase IS4